MKEGGRVGSLQDRALPVQGKGGAFDKGRARNGEAGMKMGYRDRRWGWARGWGVAPVCWGHARPTIQCACQLAGQPAIGLAITSGVCERVQRE